MIEQTKTPEATASTTQTNQTNNQVENVNNSNQVGNQKEQTYEQLVQEIQSLKEHILNIKFESKTPLEPENETEQIKKEFKLG